MLLMTKELEEKLNQYPIGSQDELGEDTEVIAKYFNPCGADTWLIAEGEKQEKGDWLLYGYMHIVEWEWVMLCFLN